MALAGFMFTGALSDFLHSTATRGTWLLAQAGEAGAQLGEGLGEGLGDAAGQNVQELNPFISFFTNPLNLMLLSAILFMFIVVRPQQKQMKDQKKALSELKKNDRVVTASGIYGTVTQANANETVVTIRIDESSGAKMTVNRDSISNIISTDSKE